MRRPSQHRWRTVVAPRRPCCPFVAVPCCYTLFCNPCCMVWARCWGSGNGTGAPRTLYTQKATHLRLTDKTNAGSYRPPTMSLWKRLIKATVQHGMVTAWYMWINIDRLSTACGRLAQFRLLQSTKRKFTNVDKTRTVLLFGVCLIILMMVGTAVHTQLYNFMI